MANLFWWFNCFYTPPLPTVGGREKQDGRQVSKASRGAMTTSVPWRPAWLLLQRKIHRVSPRTSQGGGSSSLPVRWGGRQETHFLLLQGIEAWRCEVCLRCWCFQGCEEELLKGTVVSVSNRRCSGLERRTNLSRISYVWLKWFSIWLYLQQTHYFVDFLLSC